MTILYKTRAGRFWDSEKREYIAHSVVEGAVGGEITKARVKMKNLTRALIAGNLQIDEWQIESAQILKSLHVGLSKIGSGGKWTSLNLSTAGVALKKEYARLQALAEKVAAGSVSDKKLLFQSSLYPLTARATFYNTLHKVKKAEGFLLAKRTLDPNAAHCPECLGYVTDGIVPVEDVVPKGASCSCGGRCRCKVVYYRVLPGAVSDLSAEVIEKAKKRQKAKGKRQEARVVEAKKAEEAAKAKKAEEAAKAKKAEEVAEQPPEAEKTQRAVLPEDIDLDYLGGKPASPEEALSIEGRYRRKIISRAKRKLPQALEDYTEEVSAAASAPDPMAVKPKKRLKPEIRKKLGEEIGALIDTANIVYGDELRTVWNEKNRANFIEYTLRTMEAMDKPKIPFGSSPASFKKWADSFKDFLSQVDAKSLATVPDEVSSHVQAYQAMVGKKVFKKHEYRPFSFGFNMEQTTDFIASIAVRTNTPIDKVADMLEAVNEYTSSSTDFKVFDKHGIQGGMDILGEDYGKSLLRQLALIEEFRKISPKFNPATGIMARGITSKPDWPVLQKLKDGGIYQSQGIESWTDSSSAATGFALTYGGGLVTGRDPVKLVIENPKKHRGFSVDFISSFGGGDNEREIFMPPNSRFRAKRIEVIKKQQAGKEFNFYVVYLEEI